MDFCKLNPCYATDLGIGAHVYGKKSDKCIPWKLWMWWDVEVLQNNTVNDPHNLPNLHTGCPLRYRCFLGCNVIECVRSVPMCQDILLPNYASDIPEDGDLHSPLR